jgi:hydrogenase maturation protease
MKTIILGMGNTLLYDDGIGIIIKRYLEKHFEDYYQDIDFVETSWGGFRIIDLLRDYDSAVIIDSIVTKKKPVGYIHHLTPKDLLPSLRLNSYHDINFITALDLAKSLKVKMPDIIDIFAVEIENNYTISEQIDPVLWRTITECSLDIIAVLMAKELIHTKLDKVNLVEIDDVSKLNELYYEKQKIFLEYNY